MKPDKNRARGIGFYLLIGVIILAVIFYLTTPAEQKEKEKKENKKYMKDVLKKLDERRRLFVMDIVEGRIAQVKDEEKVKDALWSALVLNQSYLAPSQLSRFFTKQPLYACTKEEKKEASQKAAKLSILQQMLVMLNVVMNETELVKYNGTYYKENGQALMDGYKVLRLYGWSFEDEEEEKVVNGSHEFYEEESGT